MMLYNKYNDVNADTITSAIIHECVSCKMVPDKYEKTGRYTHLILA